MKNQFARNFPFTFLLAFFAKHFHAHWVTTLSLFIKRKFICGSWKGIKTTRYDGQNPQKFLSSTFNTSVWETNVQILWHRTSVTEVSAYKKLQ